ncbi:hypothetical protein N008_21235 (plasmid) [Hymenobacter sp. APR13]|nr:hypothetical protein N008_21235 [Hymenobacter sp. APR13]
MFSFLKKSNMFSKSKKLKNQVFLGFLKFLKKFRKLIY